MIADAQAAGLEVHFLDGDRPGMQEHLRFYDETPQAFFLRNGLLCSDRGAVLVV